MGTSPFLRARWVDLGIFTYRVPVEVVAPLLPAELEADRLPGDRDDVAYASLVAFRFLDTRIKGIAIPGHSSFPEVNLRVYARLRSPPQRRGVLFVAEFVPKLAVAAVANTLYSENYEVLPMDLQVRDVEPSTRELTCTIERGERVHRLSVRGARTAEMCSEDSIENFFKEHEWGFGRSDCGELIVYRVVHPPWAIYPVETSDGAGSGASGTSGAASPGASSPPYSIDFGFGELYGRRWSVLDGAQPFHVMLAAGSEVTVFGREAPRDC
jgi:hypothetical protein